MVRSSQSQRLLCAFLVSSNGNSKTEADCKNKKSKNNKYTKTKTKLHFKITKQNLRKKQKNIHINLFITNGNAAEKQMKIVLKIVHQIFAA